MQHTLHITHSGNRSPGPAGNNWDQVDPITRTSCPLPGVHMVRLPRMAGVTVCNHSVTLCNYAYVYPYPWKVGLGRDLGKSLVSKMSDMGGMYPPLGGTPYVRYVRYDRLTPGVVMWCIYIFFVLTSRKILGLEAGLSRVLLGCDRGHRSTSLQKGVAEPL